MSTQVLCVHINALRHRIDLSYATRIQLVYTVKMIRSALIEYSLTFKQLLALHVRLRNANLYVFM